MTATAEPAVACSCVPSDQAEHIATAEVIFTGRFVDTDPDAEPVPDRLPPTTVRHRFAVDRVYKGTATVDQAVSSPGQESACGVSFPPGRYVVFAYRTGDELGTSLCSGTARLAEAEVPAGLGPGVAPLPPTTTEPPPTAPRDDAGTIGGPDGDVVDGSDAGALATRIGLALLVGAALLAGVVAVARFRRGRRRLRGTTT